MIHTVWSAPADNQMSPAAKVRDFVGWDAKPRALRHAAQLVHTLGGKQRVFIVTDAEGMVIWRSRTV